MTNKLMTIKGTFALVTGAICQALGGWDMALQVLASLVVLDYMTGVLVAIFEKKLSSEIGGKGIVKKIMIFALVYLAVLVDRAMSTDFIRIMTIMFYIANEGISILENAGKLGVKYPQKLKDVLLQLEQKNTGSKGGKK